MSLKPTSEQTARANIGQSLFHPGHFSKYSREWSVAAVLAGLLGVLAILAPQFFQVRQLLPALTGTAPVLLVACAMAMVILTKQIDISVGSQFAMCSIGFGLLARSHAPTPIAALAAIVMGGCFGAFNGLFVAGLRLPSIVVTLATMVTWREGLRWWREGEAVRDLPANFQWFGLTQLNGEFVLLGFVACLFLFLAFGLKYLSGGRHIYAVGSDDEAARLAGLRPRLLTFFVFLLMGAVTGLAAVLNAIRFPDIDPKTGTGLELQAIAAAVVGGVAISGGRGNLWGVLAGALLLACISPALSFLHFQPQWEKAVQGGIILLAVAADGWRGLKGSSNKTVA